MRGCMTKEEVLKLGCVYIMLFSKEEVLNLGCLYVTCESLKK